MYTDFIRTKTTGYFLDPKYVGQEVTATMDFVPRDLFRRNYAGKLAYEDDAELWLDVILTERKWGVKFEVNDTMPGLGTFEVNITGDYANVFALLADQWGSNEMPSTMTDFVGMCIGDDEARERWNKS